MRHLSIKPVADPAGSDPGLPVPAYGSPAIYIINKDNFTNKTDIKNCYNIISNYYASDLEMYYNL